MPATAGDMRTVAHVQRADEEISPDGDVLRTYRTITTCRGKLTPLKGREYWSAQETKSQVTHRFETRYGVEITSKDRLLIPGPRVSRDGHRGRVLNIESVINVDEQSRELQIMCIEEAARWSRSA